MSPRTPTEALAQLEAQIRGSARGRWLVLTHDNPDPDALAAGVALAKLLRQRFSQRVTLAYGGIIGRAENQEMVRALNLELSRLRHISFKNYQHFALVDSQPRTGNHQLPDEIVPDLVFDHHPLRKTSQGVPFVDVRTDYGATASIVAEYLLAADLPVTRKEATAMVYAIRSETLDFSREAAGADRPIYDHFLRLADKRLLGRIQNPPLPADYFATLHDALENLATVDSLIVSQLGPISQPDIVPEIADLLLRMQGKTWSLVSGQFEGRIYCSIRTSNPRANAARLMRRLLGRRGKGGGHGMIAGGWLPVADRDQASRQQAELGRRLARLLRKKPDRLTELRLRSGPEPPANGNGAPK
ncbi:MAG TPA: DHHA1 domain-containing protein [Thermoanaerobaculia bacterium]|nr:DHHA1 domain-containing protein [Thermoanaerobaculia bacterium]